MSHPKDSTKESPFDQVRTNILRSWMLMASFVVPFGVFAAIVPDRNPAIIGLVTGVLVTVYGYYQGDHVILDMLNALPVNRSRFAHYANCVEGLAIAAGLPCPSAYVIDHPAPNALSLGRNPEHASICVTTGLIQALNRVELEGVISHEMAHIKSYDTRFATLAALFVICIQLICRQAVVAAIPEMATKRWFRIVIGLMLLSVIASSIGLALSGDLAMAIKMPVSIILIFLFMGAIGIVPPKLAEIIQAAVSRERDLLADATAAVISRHPEGLASALLKIKNNPRKLNAVHPATAHLFIENPFSGDRPGMRRLLTSQPTIEERVERLRNLHGQRS